MRDLDPSQYGEADRREVDPPVEVEAATWSAGGQLDWWVKSASSGWDGYAVQTAVNDGSKLLIFGQPKSLDDHGLSLSLVVRRMFTECHNRLSAWTIYAELSRMDRPVFRSFLWRPAQRSR